MRESDPGMIAQRRRSFQRDVREDATKGSDDEQTLLWASFAADRAPRSDAMAIRWTRRGVARPSPRVKPVHNIHLEKVILREQARFSRSTRYRLFPPHEERRALRSGRSPQSRNRHNMSRNFAAESHDLLDPNPEGVERRAVERTQLRLQGRYMLPDRREFGCFTINISQDGALLHGPETCGPGSRLVIHLDHIGSLESVVAWSQQNRFAVRFVAPPRKTQKVAQRIDRLLHASITEDRRDQERLLQNYDRVTIERADGVVCIARLEDISANGAALITSAQFHLGEAVVVDRRPGRVKRCFENGIAVEFDSA